MIAKDIQVKCNDINIPNQCITLNDSKKIAVDIKDKSLLTVIVCSTTGNGDCPENADAWWRSIKLRSCSKDKFESMPYSVLGLGDTNYDKFCIMGKNIDKRLHELGAKRALELCCADEATGLEEVIECWKEKIMPLITLTYSNAIAAANSNSNSNGNGSDGVDSKDGNDRIDSSSSNINSIDDASVLPDGVMSIALVANALHIGDKLATAPDASLLPKLKGLSSITSADLVSDIATTSSASTVANGSSENNNYSFEQPYSAEVINAHYLTKNHPPATTTTTTTADTTVCSGSTAWSEARRVIHMDLLISGSGIMYSPGDTIGIRCNNRQNLKETIINRIIKSEKSLNNLVVNHNTKLKVVAASTTHSYITIDDLFTSHIDLTGPLRKNDIFTLAQFATDTFEKNQLQWLCSKGDAGKKLWNHFVSIQCLGLVDLLLLFPSISPPLSVFYNNKEGVLLSPMLPRYYSVTTSSLLNPYKIGIAFSVVQYTCIDNDLNQNINRGINRIGSCTGYLESVLSSYLLPSSGQAAIPVRIDLFLKPTVYFHLPGSVHPPLLLIGPGTGVSPFIGFLEHRAALEADKKRGGVRIHTYTHCRLHLLSLTVTLSMHL